MSERVANIEPRNSGYIADIDSGMSGLIQIGEERRVRVRERLDINPGSDEDVPGLCLDDYKSKPGFIGMMMGGFGKIAQGVKQVADCYRKRRRTKNADKIKLKLMCCLPEFDCHTVVKFPVRFREGNGPADGTDWDHGVLTVGPIPKHKAARYSIIFPPTQVDLATTTDQSIGVYVLIPSQFITLKTGKKSSRHYDYYNWKFVHKQTLGSPNWEQATWNIRFEHAWEELCLHACAATLLPQTYSEAMKEALFLLRCELMQDVGPVLEQFMLKYEQELAARRARASEMLYGASLLNISRYFACAHH